LKFDRDVLHIDAEQVAETIGRAIRFQVLSRMKRRGAVVGVSGGVDSATVLSLCARALGADRTIAMYLPERHTGADSLRLAKLAAAHAGVEFLVRNIDASLDALGCYEKLEAAVRSLFPDFGPKDRFRIVLPGNPLDDARLNFFSIEVQSASGEWRRKRLPLREYLEIVAASNMKQRTRMLSLYYEAERRNYIVAGTPNRNEDSQGFFVKYGDGGADIRPIVNLYKTQVYQLAEFLEIPEEIRSRTPTTDTYSAEVSQTEFYFRIDFERMDLLLYARAHGVPAAEVARVLDLKPEQVERAWQDFDHKEHTTAYLHMAPVAVDPFAECEVCPTPCGPEPA